MLGLPDGRTMLQTVAATLIEVCGRVVLAGGDPDWLNAKALADLSLLPDLHPGEGPLAGTLAALASHLSSGYLVVGCDQPLVPPSLYRRLAKDHSERMRLFRSDDGNIHPLPAYFPASLREAVSEALSRGERSLRQFALAQAMEWIAVTDEEESLLMSINTPDEFRQLLIADS